MLKRLQFTPTRGLTEGFVIKAESRKLERIVKPNHTRKLEVSPPGTGNDGTKERGDSHHLGGFFTSPPKRLLSHH